MDAVLVQSATRRSPQAPTARARDKKAHGRSRLTNHSDLLPGVNGNHATARRYRDLVQGYLTDMGGVELCSSIKIGLLRRLAATTVQAELLEAKMVEGQTVDIPTLCLLSSTCMRLSSRLGLERKARDVTTPTLGDLIKSDQLAERARLVRERAAYEDCEDLT
jgi:hypothetical protein